jgi:hypothetical protein
MKKTITKSVAQTINVCDLCQNDRGTDATKCWICGQDCCYKCRKMLFCAKGGSGDLVEMGFYVCSACQAGEWQQAVIELIQSKLDQVNLNLRDWLTRWKNVAKKRLEGKEKS